MAVPGPVAADVSAARGVARWGATLGLRLEVVHDCQSAPMALARDFPLAMAEPGHLLSLAHSYAREQRLTQQPRDGWQKAVYQRQLLAERVLRAAPPRALLEHQSVPDDESELS
jgi:hypothetical protein